MPSSYGNVNCKHSTLNVVTVNVTIVDRRKRIRVKGLNCIPLMFISK